MEAIMDRYGGVIAIVLAVWLLLVSILGFFGYQGIDKRIEYLEGCCKEVQEQLESGTSQNESAMKSYVDEQVQQAAESIKQSVTQEIEERSTSMKEELSSEISETVKKETEYAASKTTSTKTGKAKKSVSSGNVSGQTGVTAGSISSSTQTSTVTSETVVHSSSDEYDPDDKHFKVGSGDEDDDD